MVAMVAQVEVGTGLTEHRPRHVVGTIIDGMDIFTRAFDTVRFCTHVYVDTHKKVPHPSCCRSVSLFLSLSLCVFVCVRACVRACVRI